MKSIASRRDILKMLALLPFYIVLRNKSAYAEKAPIKPIRFGKSASVYQVKNRNTRRATYDLIEMFGGIGRYIDKEDIVVLKPNSQWWSQGMTNTDVMTAFIENVLSIPGFNGEIIIADNHQIKGPDNLAWNTKKRNGRFNFNEVVEYFNEKGYQNVTKYHWKDAGPNPRPLEGNASGDSVVKFPSEGDGYIWPKDLFYEDPYKRRVLLSYPVFTSAYSGVTIDFKKGAFKDGNYTGQPVKIINFPSLNHHGTYAGMTGAVKNFMGVVDMSCGWPAPLPKGTYNTHHIGVTPIFKTLSRIPYIFAIPGFYNFIVNPMFLHFHFTGGVLGRFFEKVRKPDLNIMTAVNVGWGSRIDVKKSSREDQVLASVDPVALDYWSSKHVLLPATKRAHASQEYIELNDPDKKDGPLWKFIIETLRETEGVVEDEKIKVFSKIE